jgi:plastocyanin
LRVSTGLAFLLLIALMVFIGPDPIFIVMALLLLGGLVLTRWKTRIGAVVILLPSVALLVFGGPNLPFAVSNPIAVIDVTSALFFMVTVLAIVNIVAIIATLTEGFLPPLRSPRGSLVLAVLAVLFVVAIGGLGTAARLGFSSANASAGDTRLDMKDFKFSNESLDVNGPASVYLTNSDPTAHTFTIEGSVNQVVPANSSARVGLNLKPGQYKYICAVPGHEQTMHGTMTVH